MGWMQKIEKICYKIEIGGMSVVLKGKLFRTNTYISRVEKVVGYNGLHNFYIITSISIYKSKLCHVSMRVENKN